MKWTYKQKVEIYKRWKYEGLGPILLSHIYKMDKSSIRYYIRLIEKHGIEILKHKHTYYPPDFKQKAIDRVLINNEPVKSVAIDLGLPDYSILRAWIKKYIDNGYSIIELKRGRKKNEENERRTFGGEQETSREDIK